MPIRRASSVPLTSVSGRRYSSRPWVIPFELRGQFLGCLDQNRRVDPHCEEQGTPLQVLARELPVRGERARRLARSADRRDTLKYGGPHGRIGGLAEQAHRRRQIRGTEENSVDAIHRGNALEMGQRVDGFHLDEYAHF